MKIYRYSYKDREVKVDTFECDYDKRCHYYTVGIEPNYLKRINDKQIETIIIPDKEMWSFNSDKIEDYMNLLIDYIDKVVQIKAEEIKELHSEIKFLISKLNKKEDK